MNASYAETIHCPHCGRFVRDVVAKVRDESLRAVRATCAQCGTVDNPTRVVDGEAVGWSWEDFAGASRRREGAA